MCLALRTRLALVSFRPKYAKITPVLQATLAHKMAKNYEISVYFSITQDLSFMSRLAIISKFKCAGLQMKDATELENCKQI